MLGVSRQWLEFQAFTTLDWVQPLRSTILQASQLDQRGKKKMRMKISPEMTLFPNWQQSRELITAVLARVWGRR